MTKYQKVVIHIIVLELTRELVMELNEGKNCILLNVKNSKGIHELEHTNLK